MKIPVIIILCLQAVNLLLSAYRHGKPKTGNENFWVNLIAAGLSLALLFWAGLFN